MYAVQRAMRFIVAGAAVLEGHSEAVDHLLVLDSAMQSTTGETPFGCPPCLRAVPWLSYREL